MKEGGPLKMTLMVGVQDMRLLEASSVAGSLVPVAVVGLEIFEA